MFVEDFHRLNENKEPHLSGTGRALQVWTLWDRAIGPKSIGLTSQSRTLQLNLETLPETVADQLFEITLEPEGGSPIGRPTGPILFKGTAARTL